MTESAPTRAVNATVRGRVQGVGFRFFVRDTAENLGLTGWTRNAADGQTVEVVAEGEPDALRTLLGQLRKGPPGALVEQVDEEWTEPHGTFHRFEIRH